MLPLKIQTLQINIPFVLVWGDCADFHINELSPWNKDWYSRKFLEPGLKYFAACAIHSKNNCYASCPIPENNHEGNFLAKTILMDILDHAVKKGIGHHTSRSNCTDTWYCMNCFYRDFEPFPSVKTLLTLPYVPP